MPWSEQYFELPVAYSSMMSPYLTMREILNAWIAYSWGLKPGGRLPQKRSGITTSRNCSRVPPLSFWRV